MQQHLPFTVLKRAGAANNPTYVFRLQQHLPFTVLKLFKLVKAHIVNAYVATALTVYGIETYKVANNINLPFFCVATALTVYGIETISKKAFFKFLLRTFGCNSTYRLRY